ncbi:MAG: stage II sporulation protein M [Saccharolobus sp.]|uniref:Integral membrane protein n=1 Tax=Saccharolobus shibatae (strain ATCC 51178 / DSM 5389 / JCM 8931 / NBRC 15437 / B12) TaxID=523848 RepID=A0A8F5BM58_SACSH|nr:stage II sporulation protein M [Saccharolobus shibatae]MCH4815618.1 stage II sporulation protein M [Saccharolobus shibatae]QXJ27656.1 putative integral membrane protein [Saccharolobus shibatae B12]
MRVLTKIILIVFVFEVVLFLIASGIPQNNPSLVSAFNSTENQVLNQSYFGKVLMIFGNNVRVAFLDFIPAVGMVILAVSIYSTGAVLSAFSSSLNVPGILSALGLMTLPHSWLELPSYAVAASSGLYIVIRPREWVRGLLTLIIVPIELFLAALVESGEFYVSNPYILWLYSIPAFVFLYFLYEFLQKRADRYIKVKTPVTQQQNVIQIQQPTYADYITRYNQSWNTASYYETQGNLAEAMRYYWEAIFYLITAVGNKLGMPTLTKEDQDNVIKSVAYKVGNPQLYDIYNEAFKIRIENRLNDFQIFKEYLSQLTRYLNSI